MTASLRLNTVEAQRLMAEMRAAGVNTIYIRLNIYYDRGLGGI